MRAMALTAAALVLPGFLITLVAEDCGGAPAPTPGVFMSEYLEGASWDKAIELYNASPESVDLSSYALWVAVNGEPFPGSVVALSGELAPGATWVVAHPSASASVLERSNATSSALAFNGDDAVGLAKAGQLIDTIGAAGSDPGAGWTLDDVYPATADHRLIRDADVVSGEADWNDALYQWSVYDPTPVTTLGAHPHGDEDAQCTSAAQCLPGLSCQGRPNPYYGAEAPGCCTDMSPIPGEGELCETDDSCGEGLICIAESCSPAWMANSFTQAPKLPLADDGVTTDVIVVSCLASVPVEVFVDVRVIHSRPEDLRITVTDPGRNVDSLVYDGAPVVGDALELTGVKVFHSGDDSVNGPWTLTLTDKVTGETGTLDQWNLHLTSRWD